VSPEISARLANLHIELAAETNSHWVFAREGCIALAHRRDDGGFASLGSSGVMTEQGLAYLLWKAGQPLLAAHGGNELPADAETVAAIQQFSRDLQTALGLDE
jgi:hypothetical protein